MDTPSIDLLDITVQRVAEWESRDAAEQLLRSELKRRPSLLGYERLLSMRAPSDDVLAGLHPLIQAQARKLARYRCSKCGFRAREFHWQCPGCTSWDSYPPRRIEELDVAT
jgi:lipopolysaccharide biosynthesis regulator YciM